MSSYILSSKSSISVRISETSLDQRLVRKPTFPDANDFFHLYADFQSHESSSFFRIFNKNLFRVLKNCEFSRFQQLVLIIRIRDGPCPKSCPYPKSWLCPSPCLKFQKCHVRVRIRVWSSLIQIMNFWFRSIFSYDQLNNPKKKFKFTEKLHSVIYWMIIGS